MSKPLILLLSIVTIPVAVAAPAAARPQRGCRDGRFVVTEGAALLGDVLVVDGGRFRVEGSCPTAGKAGRAGKRGTRLTAAWASCASAKKLRLRATARDCSAIHGTLRVRKQHATLTAMASACGDGVVDTGAGEQCDGVAGCAAGVACDATCRCDGAIAQPLECDVEGYPCTWGEVSAEVRAQSVALADSAAAILAGGGSMADAAASIRAAGAVQVLADDQAIRFRLQGGRPVWVTGDLGSVLPAIDAATGARTTTRIRPRSVVAPGADARQALVLQPYAWQSALLADVGTTLAGILGDVRGYENDVIHARNDTFDATTVDLTDFKLLRDFEVVVIVTRGAVVCDDGPCRSTILAQYVGSPTDTALGDDDVGVEFQRSGYANGDWSIALGPDFFRHTYPGGLRDALVLFPVSNTRAGADLAQAIEGPNANVVAWNGVPSLAAIEATVPTFLQNLGMGRAIKEVEATMGDALADPGRPGVRLAVGAQDVRIRELPRIIDALTGATLDASSTVEVIGYPDDDEPDSLLLAVEVEGADEARAAEYTVVMTVDGVDVAGGTLADLATSEGDFRWSIGRQVDLGVDTSEGQAIDIEVRIGLPEGGTSIATASPTVTNPSFKPGRRWHGTASRAFTAGGAHIIMTAEVTFERDPSQDVASPYPRFLQTGGTLTWTLENAGGADACVWSAPTTVIPLDVDEYNTFQFDLTSEPVEVHAGAYTQGPSVSLDISCPGPGSTTSSTGTGGQWLLAPMSRHYAVTGAAFGGTYAASATDAFTWQFVRLE